MEQVVVETLEDRLILQLKQVLQIQVVAEVELLVVQVDQLLMQEQQEDQE